jgi:hypothetical protein
LFECVGGENSGRKRRIVESTTVFQQLDDSDMSEFDTDEDDGSTHVTTIKHRENDQLVMAPDVPPILINSRIPPWSLGPTSAW